MGSFVRPPTYADIAVKDQRTQRIVFNPTWLKWYGDVADALNNVKSNFSATNGTNTPVTTATPLNLFQFTAPRTGFYNLGGQIWFTFGATTVPTLVAAGWSSNSATRNAQNELLFQYFPAAPVGDLKLAIPTTQMFRTAGQICYLVVQANFTTSTCSVGGFTLINSTSLF